MGERFFDVKETAKILGCSTRTVQRLLADGWLKGPVGRPKKDVRALISEKSVFQLMIYDCISHFPIKVLREAKSGRTIFAGLSRQIEDANCLSIDEGTGAAAQGPGSLPQQDNEPPKKCLHHDFAAEHQFSFGWIARQLVKDDPALQDDLVQEMSLAVLEHKKPASCEYLLQLAENRAKNYLIYEASRGMLPLCEAREESDSLEAKMESLRHLIESLIKRGVPAEWIEEVLGEQWSDEGLANAG